MSSYKNLVWSTLRNIDALRSATEVVRMEQGYRGAGSWDISSAIDALSGSPVVRVQG